VGVVGNEPLFHLSREALGAPLSLEGLVLPTLYRALDHSAHRGDHSWRWVGAACGGKELRGKHSGGGKTLSGSSRGHRGQRGASGARVGVGAVPYGVVRAYGLSVTQCRCRHVAGRCPRQAIGSYATTEVMDGARSRLTSWVIQDSSILFPLGPGSPVTNGAANCLPVAGAGPRSPRRHGILGRARHGGPWVALAGHILRPARR
jgi:hypothetical protein